MTDPIAAYYDELATRHGNTPQAVDATSQEALNHRYQALGDVADMNGKRVLEVGCGHGGLGAYLTHRYPEINYRGTDVSTKLIEIGRQAHPELRLFEANVLNLAGHYDIVLAQGIFYKLDRRRWEQTKALVAKMYALADEAAAFTALVTWEHRPSADEYRLDPARTLAYCRTLTPRVSFRSNYHPGDALFTLRRKDR